VADASGASVKRRDRKKVWLELGKGVFWIMTFFQLVVVAWFSGAIARREQSLYVWDEYVLQFRRFGTANAAFSAALYLLYYAFIVELAYVALSGLLRPDEPNDTARAWNHRMGVLCCSLWVLFTFLTFGDSIFQFIRSVPTEVMNGWLIILWGGSAYLASRFLWNLFEQRRNERNEKLRERIDKHWLDTLCHNYRLEQRLFKQWLDTLCQTPDTSSQKKEPTYKELLQRLKELEDAGLSDDET